MKEIIRKLCVGAAFTCVALTALGVVLPRKAERHDDEPASIIKDALKISRAVWGQIRRFFRVKARAVSRIKASATTTMKTAQCT